MEGDVPVELLEEPDSITNQDRQYRIAHLVRQPETKAFGGDHPASHKPDGTEPGPQATIHELGEIAGVELDRVPDPRELASSEDEGGLVAVRPAEPLGFETKRGLVGSRSHDVAVDRLEEGLDESRVHRVAAGEFVRRLQPVDS